jgi:hypothetical protein
MKDLANERAAAVSELARFNFQPVNAEAILPDGGRSWDVIEAEIAQCDVFVLILGESYGWIPTSGPHGVEGLGVTELEYLEACRRGIPILPFCKRLGYDAVRDTSDAKLRDRFRKDVESWDEGHFRTDFDLALDLAPKVGRAVVDLLTAKWRELESRRSVQRRSARTSGARALTLPPSLVRVVADRSALLFAGAGMSMQAGLPSAYAFAEHILAKISELDPSYVRGAHAGNFNDLATDFALLAGSAGLRDAVAELMGVEALVGPSSAQRTAVSAFDMIVTTNYDTLLERADEVSRLTVVAEEFLAPLPRTALVKLHGTMNDPKSLVVTSEDLLSHGNRRQHVIEAVRTQVLSRSVVVVGSSLRDPTTEALFTGRSGAPPGWVVAPHFSEVDRLRLQGWDLQPVTATAESFFTALAHDLRIRSMTGSVDES